MMIDQMDVKSIPPKRNVTANIHVEHTQLRDLISCPNERGEILFASTSGLSARNLALDESERNVPNVSFAPTCVTTGSGLVAAGGVHADLFLAPISAIPSYPAQNTSAESNGNWTSTVRLRGSINNALFFTNLALASSPYHLPSSYNAFGTMPRLFVSNNDCTMRVYNVATHDPALNDDHELDASQGRRRRQHRLTKAGDLHANTCVNHASISPDGRTLLAVGDTPSVYLYTISGGNNVIFSPIATYSDVFSDAAFSTAWSSDGLKYAVASQDGCVKVWDVRSSRPLTTLRGVENMRGCKPRGAAPGSRTRFIPPGLDAPLPDGSQFMSLAPPPSLFGVPTSLSSEYYGTLDGGGHFGTPVSHSAAAIVPSNANIPDKEMNLVIPGIRTLKFVKSGGREVLAFSEHLSHVHLVDAQTFNEHTVLRVPAPPPSPRISPQSRTLPNPASRSTPSVQIPAPSTNQDPWPVSAWCSPTNSPTSSPRAQWPSGTLLPSIHDAQAEERIRNRTRHLHNHPLERPPPPPSVYADVDLRINAAGSSSRGMFDLAPTAWVIPPSFRPTSAPSSSVEIDPRTAPSWPPRGLVTSSISGALYEFVPPPASSHRYDVPLHPQYRQPDQYNMEEDEEDKPATHPSSPQDPRDPRLQNLLMNLTQSTRAQHNAMPAAAASSTQAPPRTRLSTNIRIVHHPATRTRAVYDERNKCTHLSGMCFDPTGRWMYASTERSIAEWDMEEVLGGQSTGQESWTMWGKTVFDEGAEWT